MRAEGSATALDRIANGAHEPLGPERLQQKFDGARLHRLDRRWNVGVARDVDNRDVRTSGELRLQFETAQSGKRQIGDHTARPGAARMREKLLCRSEARGLQA